MTISMSTLGVDCSQASLTVAAGSTPPPRPAWNGVGRVDAQTRNDAMSSPIVAGLYLIPIGTCVFGATWTGNAGMVPMVNGPGVTSALVTVTALPHWFVAYTNCSGRLH